MKSEVAACISTSAASCMVVITIKRQKNGKARSFTNLSSALYRATLSPHDRLGNSKSQSTTSRFARFRTRGAVEPFKNVRQVFAGNPHSLVMEGDSRSAIILFQSNVDRGVLGRILDSVIQEDQKQLTKKNLISFVGNPLLNIAFNGN